jgi:hypothetical protein
VVAVAVKIKQTWTGLYRPWGFQEVDAPRFHDSRHIKVMSALRTVRLYSPGNIPGTYLFRRLNRTQGHRAFRITTRFLEMTGVVTLSRFRCTGVGVRSLYGKGEVIRCLGVARLLAAGSDARGRATGWFPFSSVHA